MKQIGLVGGMVVLLAGCAGAGVGAGAGGGATPERTVWSDGPLLIVGGGHQPDALITRFVAMAGGPGRARIAVIPLASGVPESGPEKVEQFEDFGAESFVLNPTRAEAMDASTGDRLDGVTGIWFTGGDQARVTAVMLDSPLLERIHELNRSGVVIGGTSAGAAIMSDSMITGNQYEEGDTAGYYGDEFPRIARDRIEVVRGLGFLHGAIVDQHFLRRERHNRLLSAVLERPTLIGVGIDESTALDVDPSGGWTIRGESQAIVFDPRGADLTPEGAPLGASGVVVHLLPPNSVFDPVHGRATLGGATLQTAVQ